MHVLILCIVLAAISVAWVTVDPEAFSDDYARVVYLLTLAVGAPFVFYMRIALKRISPDCPVLLHPPMLMTLWTLVVIFLPGYMSFIEPDVVADLQSSVGVFFNYAAWGFVLAFAGLVSLWIGYLTGYRIFRPTAIMAWFSDRGSQRQVVWVPYIAALLIHLLRISVTGMDYGGETEGIAALQWILCLEASRYLFLSIATIEVVLNRRPAWHIAFLIGVELVVTLTSGFSGTVMLTTAVVGVSAIYGGAKIRHYLPLLIPAALLIPTVIPISEDLRLQYRLGAFDPRSPSSILSAVDGAYSNTWGRGTDLGVNIALAKIFGRQAVVAHIPGIIIKKTPAEIPYIGASGFASIPTFVIPRVLWPDKPTVSTGRLFSSDYLDMPIDTTSSSAMTIFGETYMFCGFVGVICGLFALGLLLAFMFQNTVAAGTAPLLISLMPILLAVEGQFVMLVLNVIQQALMNCIVLSMVLLFSGVLQQAGRSAHPAGVER